MRSWIKVVTMTTVTPTGWEACPFDLRGSPGLKGVRSENEHQPHAKRTEGLFAVSLALFAAQSSNKLSQLDSLLCTRAVTIISIPLTRGRAAAGTMHPANLPPPYSGRATALAGPL